MQCLLAKHNPHHPQLCLTLSTQDNEPDGTLGGEDFDAVVGKADHQANSIVSISLSVTRTASFGHGLVLETQRRHPTQKPPAWLRAHPESWQWHLWRRLQGAFAIFEGFLIRHWLCAPTSLNLHNHSWCISLLVHILLNANIRLMLVELRSQDMMYMSIFAHGHMGAGHLTVGFDFESCCWAASVVKNIYWFIYLVALVSHCI